MRAADIPTVLIPSDKLVSNQGQIKGINRNPRIIRDKKYEELKKSISTDPGMMNLNNLWVFPYRDQFIVMVGNQRLSICKELEWPVIPCKVIPKETPKKTIRGWIIKENRHAGEDDMDALTEWDLDELMEFGVTIEGADMNDPFDDEGILPKEQFGVIVMCKDAQEQERIFNRFQDEGFDCKVVVV